MCYCLGIEGGLVSELVGGGQRRRKPGELQGEGGVARSPHASARSVRQLQVLRGDSSVGQEPRRAQGEMPPVPE